MDRMSTTTFDDLIAIGEAADVTGWDFSWLDGRATEERPPWGTVERYRDRLRDLHELIQRDGPFVAHSTRHLIEARRPV